MGLTRVNDVVVRIAQLAGLGLIVIRAVPTGV
jgi:hypothetical protein